MTDAEELREALNALRAAHFDAGGSACDYAGLGASPEKQRLAEMLAALQAFDPKRVRIVAQTAFWLNVFNAVVVRDAAELAQARGPREVERFFESRRANIGGLAYSLDDIEHGLLRGNVPKFGGMRAPLRQDDPRRAYTPLAYDERMHFGLYCACRSSPPLHAAGRGLRFRGGGIVGQAQEFHAPRAAVQHRAFGEFGSVLTLRVDRAHVDEVEPLAREARLERELAGRIRAVHLVDFLEVAVAEEAQPGARELG